MKVSEGDGKPSICSLCKLKKVMIYGSQLQRTYMLNLLFFFFFPPLCRLTQGRVRVPFSAAHPHHCAVCGTLWWTAPETGQCIYKMNRAPSIGWRRDWKTLPPVCRECREETNYYQICINWCTALPVAVLTHLPLSMFHHLISHVCLSVSSYLQTQTERGQLWLFLRPHNSCNPRMALHLFKSCSG